MTKAEGRKENGDLWGNARRSSKIRSALNRFQNIRAINTQRYRGQGEARETLKAAMKNRLPVAEIVKEITKVKVQVKVEMKFGLKGE